MVRSILSTAMLRLAGSVSETLGSVTFVGGGHHRVRGFKGATETVRRIVEEGSPSVGEQYTLIVVMYCRGTGSDSMTITQQVGSQWQGVPPLLSARAVGCSLGCSR